MYEPMPTSTAYGAHLKSQPKTEFNWAASWDWSKRPLFSRPAFGNSELATKKQKRQSEPLKDDANHHHSFLLSTVTT